MTQPTLTEPTLTEPSPAPEILVDGYASATVHNGVARFSFFALAHDPANDLHERRLNLRLAMSLTTLVAVQQAFGTFIEQLQAQAREEPGTQ